MNEKDQQQPYISSPRGSVENLASEPSEPGKENGGGELRRVINDL